jgi:hypothetical protein
VRRNARILLHHAACRGWYRCWSPNYPPVLAAKNWASLSLIQILWRHQTGGYRSKHSDKPPRHDNPNIRH